MKNFWINFFYLIGVGSLIQSFVLKQVGNRLKSNAYWFHGYSNDAFDVLFVIGDTMHRQGIEPDDLIPKLRLFLKENQGIPLTPIQCIELGLLKKECGCGYRLFVKSVDNADVILCCEKCLAEYKYKPYDRVFKKIKEGEMIFD